VYATAAIAQIASSLEGQPAPTLTLERSGDGSTCYRFDRDRFMALAGRCFANAIPWEVAAGARQLFVRREADGSYLVAVTSPVKLLARPAGAGGITSWSLTEEPAAGEAAPRIVASASAIDLEAGRMYRLAPAR
jgi:hypothetical protein